MKAAWISLMLNDYVMGVGAHADEVAMGGEVLGVGIEIVKLFDIGTGIDADTAAMIGIEPVLPQRKVSSPD